MSYFKTAIIIITVVIIGFLFLYLPLYIKISEYSIPHYISRKIKPPPVKLESNISKLEKDIHNLINIEREKQGLSGLEWSEELAAIARSHSRDMAKKDYFSHYDLENRSFVYRYEKAGFECMILINVTNGYEHYAIGAENIFRNSLAKYIYADGTVAEYNTMEEIAESTVSGWMESEGHRENILTPYWKSEGMGIAVSDLKVYITQNFC